DGEFLSRGITARHRLVHAERAGRVGFGLAGFSEQDLEVSIGDWKLWRGTDDRIHTRIDDDAFGMALLFAPPGPPVLQGDQGFSRKGPLPGQASWYYSQPQLTVSGTVRGPGDAPVRAVTGTAWLDREWSTEYLDKRASGWDWCGLNFDDGSALMAFRIRLRDGGVLWSYANWLPSVGPAGRAVRVDSAELTNPASLTSTATPRTTPDPEFVPLRHWRSPRTDIRWPVAMQLRIGERQLELHPLFDDQELSAEESTGTIYWEGAVRVFEAGRQVGAGYMELTGYAGRVRM
ncbi:MAG TPA: lipocalin family protein, partial [Burkholderiaceae bacterium]|nr:lipocalin family protein [Burkholderiaceae bacterium]